MYYPSSGFLIFHKCQCIVLLTFCPLYRVYLLVNYHEYSRDYFNQLCMLTLFQIIISQAKFCRPLSNARQHIHTGRLGIIYYQLFITNGFLWCRQGCSFDRVRNESMTKQKHNENEILPVHVAKKKLSLFWCSPHNFIRKLLHSDSIQSSGRQPIRFQFKQILSKSSNNMNLFQKNYRNQFVFLQPLLIVQYSVHLSGRPTLPIAKHLKSIYSVFFYSYLSCRSKQIIIASCIVLSVPLCVTSGVPQRSHLRPLAFLLLPNEVVDCFEVSVELFCAEELTVVIKTHFIRDSCNLQNNLKTCCCKTCAQVFFKKGIC